MPTRRFRKRGGACEDNPDECTMVEKAANIAKAPFGIVSNIFGESKKVAEDVVGTGVGAVGTGMNAVTATVGQLGSMITPSSASTPEQKGGKRRKTKRRRAKRRTRR